ncbi:hypothetical protein HN681_03160 [archaeon]|jgi:hypothetical protein|nr:hypothetical protein [archaeon]MBT3730864.1 hypothetical protein [archaeon]MBT4669897.1 hypothetical protein [archaeon]MBT5030049.1 hypothetical protein [archaeon]MBT5288150.1 hypothetical protein [archaeon]
MIDVLLKRNGSAIGVNPYFANGRNYQEIVEELRDQVFGVEMWLRDLDGTDANPATDIAFRAVGTSYTDLKYINWCFATAFALAKDKKSAESSRWNEYVDQFLKDKSPRELIRQFSEEIVEKSLYPGVKEWNEGLNGAARFYVTRNIGPITFAFARSLGIQAAYTEVQDKSKVVKELLERFNGDLQRVGVEGDTIEDAVMVDEVRRLGKKVLGIQVMKKINGTTLDSFDIYTTRDRRALLEILEIN